MSFMSDRTPKLPRLGKVRAGIKGDNSFPKNVAHFIFPTGTEQGADLIPADWHGTKRVVDIAFDANDIEDVSGGAYRYQLKSGLQCVGDGDTGSWFDLPPPMSESERADRNRKPPPAKPPETRPCARRGCPFFKSGVCKPSLILKFRIPAIPVLGRWHLHSKSPIAMDNVLGSLTTALEEYGHLVGYPWQLYKYTRSVQPPGHARKDVLCIGLRSMPEAARLQAQDKLKSLMGAVWVGIGDPTAIKRQALTDAFRAIVTAYYDQSDLNRLMTHQLVALADGLTPHALRQRFDETMATLLAGEAP